jgi:hypothetical protein
MMTSSGAENLHDKSLHQHFCYVGGHSFECRKDCVCICGQPMNGNDHGDCPVELRPCPKHESDQMQVISEEPLPEGVVEIKFPADLQRATLHCECGCSEIDLGEVVGWCLHCNHVYATYNPEIENRHFAYHCPGAPLQIKQDALTKFAERRAGS